MPDSYGCGYDHARSGSGCPSTVTVKYWHSPFHGQVYGVGEVVRNPSLTDEGGKYELPSMWMISSSGASAMTVPFRVAVAIRGGTRCQGSAFPARAGWDECEG